MFKTDYTANFQYIAPAVLAAGVAGAASLLGTAANTTAMGKMNKKTRKWAEKEREINRGYALQDYATMNEYNSPRAQMQRFKEAGLNPNLIYGQSNEGATVRSTDQAKWNPESPNFDLGAAAQNSIAAYQDTRMQNAQLDLIAKQQTIAEQEAILKMATTNQVVANTQKTNIENATLSKYSLEAAEASLKNMQQNTAATAQQMDLNLQKNEREALSNSQSLREGVLRVAQLKVQNAKTAEETKIAQQNLRNLQVDEELKKVDLRMKEKGVQPSDNLFFRAAAQFLGNTNLKEIGNTPEKKTYVSPKEASDYYKDRKKRKGY